MMDGMDDVVRAAALGFKRADAEQSLAMLGAVNRTEDFDVAMDLARFVRIPLEDATTALVLGGRHLRRLGFTPDRDVRADVAGQAELHAQTFYGSMDVREAQGHTFSRVFTDFVERVFGPR